MSEAYHDWSGKAADAQLRVNFTLKLLLSQNFCNRPLMRFISFASNIVPTAAVPAGLAPGAPVINHFFWVASYPRSEEMSLGEEDKHSAAAGMKNDIICYC